MTLVNVSQASELVWPLANQIRNKVGDFLHSEEIALTFTSLVSSHTMVCDTLSSHGKLPHIALSDLRAKSHYWVSQQSANRPAPPEHQQHRSSLLPRHKLSDRLLHSSVFYRHNNSTAYFLIRVWWERRGEWTHLFELDCSQMSTKKTQHMKKTAYFNVLLKIFAMGLVKSRGFYFLMARTHKLNNKTFSLPSPLNLPLHFLPHLHIILSE